MMCDEKEMAILGDIADEIVGLRKQNTDLLGVLRTLVNNLPECQIEWARSAWGNTNTACVLEARAKVVEEIAKAEGDNNG